MLKNYLRYCLPASIILLALFGWAFAGTLYNWQSSVGPVANIDTNGGFTITGSGAFNCSPTLGAGVVTGGSNGGTFTGGVLSAGTLSSGTLQVDEVCQGVGYKQLVISCSACICTGNTLQITYPASFQTTSGTLLDKTLVAPGLNLVDTAGTSGNLTVASSGSTGVLIIGGQ